MVHVRAPVSRRLMFDEAYGERVVLDDGTAIGLGLVRPRDRRLMLEAWERLSPESRYQRFHAVKKCLTEADLRYLTELDLVDHLAIGAVHSHGGVREGLGVARFVRLAGRPQRADFAVTVIDDWQRKGVGRALLTRLMAAARERGIERFESSVLATNAPMRRLIKSVAPDSTERADGRLLAVEVPLAFAGISFPGHPGRSA
jgi:GNAT superfamily N-acetyltransferase